MIVLLLHAGSTLALVGLIWFVQIVHYPLMARVGRELFAGYEQEHRRLTTWVVAPLMLTELVTSILLFFERSDRVPIWICWLGFSLLAAIWLITFLIQVPQHAALQRGFDANVHRQLVRGNWLRTIGWSMRGALTLWIMAW